MMLTRLGVCLLIAGLMAAPARSADYEKYLLDDTDAVLTVNVKQTLASPAYLKRLQKQAEGLLKMEQVQNVLRDTGFDPLQDIDRITLVVGHGSHRTEQNNNSFRAQSGPLFIVQGRFDPTRLEAKAEQLAKDFPFLKCEKVGDTKVWEITGENSLFLAVLDKNTLIGAPFKDQVTEALDKANGKRKTQLKNKAMSNLLDKMDPKATVAWAATGEMIHNTSVNSMSVNGMTVTRVEYTTLADIGIVSVAGSIMATDTLKGAMTLTAKDADVAKQIAGSLEDGLKFGIENVARAAETEKDIVPLVDAMKGLKVTSKDNTITLQGEGSAAAVEGIIKALLLVR